jgi:homoprotocatechuate degradation regulator HpaR
MAIQQFSESLPIMLYRALDAIMPRFRRIFSDFGLTEQQWRVLRVLWDSSEIALRDLSALTLIPAPSLVGIVDRLQKAGLVTRRRSDEDRRNVFVLTTVKGKDLEQHIMPRVQASYLELIQSMDADIWRNMLVGLHEVTSFQSSIESAHEVKTLSVEFAAHEVSVDEPIPTQANDL